MKFKAEVTMTGTVEVGVLINEEGQIIETKILKSLNPACDEAAIAAVQMSRWEPASARDQLVQVWVSIPVTFALK